MSKVTDVREAYLESELFAKHLKDFERDELFRCDMCGEFFDDQRDLSMTLDICEDCADSLVRERAQAESHK